MVILDILTIDRWIALASSIGTLVAAGLAVFSIRELRLQRAQQFQPRISLTGAGYEIGVRPDQLLSHSEREDLNLPVVNVGHGIATDLTVEWVVDVEDWVAQINTLSAKRGAGIGLEQDDFGLKVLYNGRVSSIMRGPEYQVFRCPFLVPVTSDSMPVRSPLPVAVIALLSAYYYCYFHKAEGVSGKRNDPVPLFRFTVNIGYKDTLDRSYVRRSFVDITMSSAALNKDGSIGLRLQVEPVSNEPAEGYSPIVSILLGVLKNSIARGVPI
ncbi:hypothetical protein SAMN06295912_10388 [Sphingomonas laterariae]|uniref:Uncharacterized protein n=1 Tax=Edaphosphingomonas laterariae TaxID=861865 RepID=A0A239CY19_9SPHN|nr:hypothetical protein [Sphingomonas laterariae]SNS24551.1 hypothetical protein SAMN06295912_10388 [Sphingomonas laterariae]